MKTSGLETICIPGPCAALTALVSSGMAASKFTFEVFTKRKIDRNKILFEISQNNKTTILFESPHRINSLFEELKDNCGGDREIQVFRELTKKFEQNVGDTIDKVIDFFKDKEIWEFTIVIKGISESKNVSFNPSLIKKELNELINAGLSPSAASKYLAKKNNLPKSMIYSLH